MAKQKKSSTIIDTIKRRLAKKGLNPPEIMTEVQEYLWQKANPLRRESSDGCS